MHLYAFASLAFFGLLGVGAAMVVLSPLLFAVGIITMGLAVHEAIRRLRRAAARRHARIAGSADVGTERPEPRVPSRASAPLATRGAIPAMAPAGHGVRRHVSVASSATVRRRRQPRRERH